MKRRITGYIITGAVCILLFLTGKHWEKEYSLQQQLAGKVLRFHVLANSDGEDDQSLKLKVRDAIGCYMQKNMEQMSSKEECEQFVKKQMSEIEQVAETVVQQEGYSYEVHAELAECEFPVKTYGAYSFPAGTYDALKVTIGAGAGRNWWCVLYPNMCFQNSMYEVTEEASGEALRAVLSEEEYEAVLKSGNYEVKFWFLEYFK